MSIQDESFPYDELFDLDSSPTPVNRFQFPHRLREGQKHQLFSEESDKNMVKPTHNLSTSNSSVTDQTISSAECTTEQPTERAAITNDSIIKSDRTGMPIGSDAPKQPLERNRKSHSYHDIHSEYTKRRYKHVESKVGQYIANIRNEDERRRRLAKIQRHRSLPEALVRDPITRERMQLQRSVTVVAERLNQALEKVIDGVDGEPDDGADFSNSNMTATTSATTSTQSGSGTTDDGDDDFGREADKSNEGGVLRENCKDGLIDKNMYALLLDERDRLKSYNDYQQSKLDEKQCEITRLRQNVDFLRVRLSTAEDQIQKSQNCRSFGYGQMGANSQPSWGVGRQSVQGLLYCTAKSTKATQTVGDICYSPSPPPPAPPTPSPPHLGIPNGELQIYVTADTPDGNNNLCSESTIEKCGRNIKSVAAIQPMALNFSNYPDGESGERRTTRDNVALRRRSNSLKARQKCVETTNAKDSDKSQYDSRASHPSSSDSAIDVEVIELSSPPKPARRKRNKIDMKEKRIHAPKVWSLMYSRGPQRTPSPTGLYIERCSNSIAMDVSATTEVQGGRKFAPKKTSVGGRSISRRWLNLFGSCVRCRNPKYTEREQVAPQHNYTQVPLLDSTFEKSYTPLQSN
ncbi:protein swallow [Anastrepha obliqua]|uniref:protein swallow n=1 Tax=Anastrepha obliqua TaxID=95512 RepID=UPI0024091499|nr:protein swallow [Anastrepha obliqua]